MKKQSYDYYLILATALVLALISVICIYGMFYFKFADINQMAAPLKAAYMDKMNIAISPFLICLLFILGICVPKRLLSTKWLNRFAMLLVLVAISSAIIYGIKESLLAILCVSLVLQIIVLFMALAGSETLNFEKKGYWVRVGSSAMHLGLILFVLDLFLYRHQGLHLALFWVTTISIVVGMIGCFYSENIAKLVRKIR